jgi:hypothetical protein
VARFHAGCHASLQGRPVFAADALLHPAFVELDDTTGKALVFAQEAAAYKVGPWR